MVRTVSTTRHNNVHEHGRPATRCCGRTKNGKRCQKAAHMRGLCRLHYERIIQLVTPIAQIIYDDLRISNNAKLRSESRQQHPERFNDMPTEKRRAELIAWDLQLADHYYRRAVAKRAEFHALLRSAIDPSCLHI